MKRIFAIIMVAAALLSLASCQKAEPTSDSGEQNNGRIISASFSNDGTKTTLDSDGKTPLWSAGDKIRVLSSTGYQDVTLVAFGSTPKTNEGEISDDSRSFSFTTTLSGSLYAIYPASATAMTSCADANITFTVPSVQDGSFASANICVASGDGTTANTIYFSNATAVVEMSLAGGVVGTKFAATNNIAGDMTVAMGTKGAISSTTTTSLFSNTISVSDTQAPTGNKFYLAVAPVDAGTVTVSCNTTTQSGSTDKGTKTLALDKIYAMDLSGMTIDADFDLTGQHGIRNGVEYVIIKAKYDGTNDSYLKWTTQNLAVTESGKQEWKPGGTSTGYIVGDYFQWAASYAGYGLTADAFKVSTNLVIYDSFTNTNAGGGSDSFNFKSTKSLGFVEDYVPYGGASYSKYTGTSGDGRTTLERSDDVANIILGGTWRVPTGGSAGEFNAMRAVTYWAWDAADKGYYVFKPGVGTTGAANESGDIAVTDDKTKALLFFPAAGFGYNTYLYFAGSFGYYWSSTLYSDSTGSACRLSFYSSTVIPESNDYRYLGFSVRPVSD